MPPLLTASVEVAETTPAVAKRVPLKEPMAKVVVVAFDVVAFKPVKLASVEEANAMRPP